MTCADVLRKQEEVLSDSDVKADKFAKERQTWLAKLEAQSDRNAELRSRINKLREDREKLREQISTAKERQKAMKRRLELANQKVSEYRKRVRGLEKRRVARRKNVALLSKQRATLRKRVAELERQLQLTESESDLRSRDDNRRDAQRYDCMSSPCFVSFIQLKSTHLWASYFLQLQTQTADV